MTIEFPLSALVMIALLVRSFSLMDFVIRNSLACFGVYVLQVGNWVYILSICFVTR